MKRKRITRFSTEEIFDFWMKATEKWMIDQSKRPEVIAAIKAMPYTITVSFSKPK